MYIKNISPFQIQYRVNDFTQGRDFISTYMTIKIEIQLSFQLFFNPPWCLVCQTELSLKLFTRRRGGGRGSHLAREFPTGLVTELEKCSIDENIEQVEVLNLSQEDNSGTYKSQRKIIKLHNNSTVVKAPLP